MSHPIESGLAEQINGPSADVAPMTRTEPQPSQQGVKVSSNISSSQPIHYSQPQQQQNFVGPRPVLRRSDSSFRPPQGQIPPSPPPQFPGQPGGIRPVLQQRPPPPQGNPNYFGPRPAVNLAPRFQPPGSPSQPPIRFPHDVSNYPEGFRPRINPGFAQRLPSQQQQIGPRPLQKSLPTNIAPVTSDTGLSVRKSINLDSSEVISHSAEQNDSNYDQNKDLSYQKTQMKSELNSSNEKLHKYEDSRSSSSLGFTHDSEKDIDTAINGKSSREEILERPESRTDFLSREHSAHSSMLKIDEDDDDAVVTPSRGPQIRSGISTPISNSTDNIPQKFDAKKSPTPPKTSTESLKMPSDTEVKLQSPNLAPQKDISRTPSPKPPVSPRFEQPNLTDDRKTIIQERPQELSTTITSNRELLGNRSFRKTPSPRGETRNFISRRPASAKSQGDNDSGVDESTQGNERSINGEQASPKKTPSKVPKLPSSKCKTPTKALQSPKSPDPSNSLSDKKKLPMNKVQVGAAPSPNIKTIKSKIGSLENTSYKPGGGKVKLENRKIDFTKVQSRIAAKNDTYSPGGGDKKIQQQKLQWSAKSKIGSLDNTTYKPGGGDKKIESVKLDFKDKAKPKVGSKDNIKHSPGGGDIKSVEEVTEEIENRKIELSAQSKIGSLDNVKHKPGGGDIKIFDDKDYLKRASDQNSVLSGSQYEYSNNEFTGKRTNHVRPPTSLNVAPASARRRVRYSDLEGPRSLSEEMPRARSVDYHRPMSACSNVGRKRSKTRISLSILNRPPWRY